MRKNIVFLGVVCGLLLVGGIVGCALSTDQKALIDKQIADTKTQLDTLESQFSTTRDSTALKLATVTDAGERTKLEKQLADANKALADVARIRDVVSKGEGVYKISVDADGNLQFAAVANAVSPMLPYPWSLIVPLVGVGTTFLTQQTRVTAAKTALTETVASVEELKHAAPEVAVAMDSPKVKSMIHRAQSPNTREKIRKIRASLPSKPVVSV